MESANLFSRLGWSLLFIVAVGTCYAGGSSEGIAALSWEAWFTVAVFVISIGTMLLELLPPDVTLLSAACVLVIFGVIEPQHLVDGFSQDIILTIALLFIVAYAIEVSGALSLMATRMLTSSSPYHVVLPLMMVSVMAFSAFLNNTPIVLMMTPFVRRWAIDAGYKPSKFLMPLSFAAILGGTCTLIGTSANLVVDGLLREQAPEAGFAFFEISRVGIPCALAGLVYMLTVGHRLLPSRDDPSCTMAAHPKEFTTEFLVSGDCALRGLTVNEASRKYWAGELLIEIERGDSLIDAPAGSEVIHEGDRLVFASNIKDIVALHSIKGLRSLQDPHFKVDETRSHFSELVVSPASTLIGRTLKSVDFRNRYGGSVMAVFRQGGSVPGLPGNVLLRSGDTLMVLSAKPWRPGEFFHNDFYAIRLNEKIELYPPWRLGLLAGILTLMVLLVILGLPLLVAAMTAAALTLLTGCLNVREARKSIQWPLLILIGGAFTVGHALVHTGVATVAAKHLLSILGIEPHILVAGTFVLTMLFTEAITNSAAALLIFPVALEMFNLAGYTSILALKAVGITIAMASSCSFMTPIGYQTNTIVYGPGGYKFTDYARVGALLSTTILVICTFLIPWLWPFA